MRFRVEVQQDGDKWRVSTKALAAGTIVSRHTLSRSESPNERFPLPPAHAKSACDPATHELCLDVSGERIAAAWEAVNRMDLEATEVKRFGRYLFQVLMADGLGALEQATGNAETLELEILIKDQGVDLVSLPWEIMQDGSGPLVARKDRKVTISRIVVPTKPIQAIPRVRLPLRVLFVVGRQIDNVLRPGAELIGLLRTIRVPSNSTFTDFRNTDLHVRYLNEASWDEIENSVATFDPTIVHMVCHGELSSDGRETSILLTSREVDGNALSPKTAEPYKCTAERLLSLFTKVPPIVIVNACHTADYGQESTARAAQSDSNIAFAATLVRGGVSMALGMSGEVADRACQLFTLRFYQALLEGSSISLAAGQGRRAALLGFSDLQERLDWARPTLFVADGIDPVLKVERADKDITLVGDRFRTLKSPEMLCDRYDSMQKYEKLLSKSSAGARTVVLAFSVKELCGGIGKTRLLEEIAARAVFDNFAPILMRNNKQSPEPPANLLEFALQISSAMAETREHFQARGVPVTRVCKLAYGLAGITPNPSDSVTFAHQQLDLQKYLQNNRTTGDPARLAMAPVMNIVREDCLELQNDVKNAFGETPRILLLLDDLERYGVVNEIVARAGEFGLGTSELPISLVFTYSASGLEGKSLEDVLRKRPDIYSFPLDAFTSPVDQRLVFGQLVLSRWKYAINNSRSKRDVVDVFYENMRLYTKGRPGQFSSPEVDVVVSVHHDLKSLVDADFEDMLRRWM